MKFSKLLVYRPKVKTFIVDRVRIATDFSGYVDTDFYLIIKPDVLWINSDYAVENEVISNTSWNIQ